MEEAYGVIENEVLQSSDFKGITVSGSLFSLTTFKSVTFESCVFFAARMENCEFIDCTFINCSFKFSNIEHCNFNDSKFENCKWDVTPIKKSRLQYCSVDAETAFYVSKSDSKIENCSGNGNGYWASYLDDFLQQDRRFEIAA